MDMNYLQLQARIREAERLRSEAVGEMLAAGWTGAKRLAVAAYRSVLDLLHAHPVVHR